MPVILIFPVELLVLTLVRLTRWTGVRISTGSLFSERVAGTSEIKVPPLIEPDRNKVACNRPERPPLEEVEEEGVDIEVGSEEVEEEGVDVEIGSEIEASEEAPNVDHI